MTTMILVRSHSKLRSSVLGEEQVAIPTGLSGESGLDPAMRSDAAADLMSRLVAGRISIPLDRKPSNESLR